MGMMTMMEWEVGMTPGGSDGLIIVLRFFWL